MCEAGTVNGAPGTRSADEIRERFIARLNSAVLRPGMYDGESTLRQLLDDLAWIDRRESPGGVYRMLEARGAASPVGVRGVFMRMFGGGIRAHDDARRSFTPTWPMRKDSPSPQWASPFAPRGPRRASGDHYLPVDRAGHWHRECGRGRRSDCCKFRPAGRRDRRHYLASDF